MYTILLFAGTPVITVQPQSQQVNPGANVSLTCSAAGTPKLTSITWKLGNTTASGRDVHVSDVILNEANTISTLNLTNVGRTTSGNYTCEVTNSEGIVTSSDAVITVLCEFFCSCCRSPTSSCICCCLLF